MKYRWFLWVAGLLSVASLSAENLSAVSPAKTMAATPLKPAVIFFFDSPASSTILPAVAIAFQQEAAVERREYPVPENFEVLSATALRPDSEFSKVVQVHLLGRCDVVEQAVHPLAPGPLGWVLRVSGEIQPFVYVNCERLAQVLNPRTLGMNDAQRADAMANAVARIAMHEWLHISLQTDVHTNRGVRRAELSANDLIAPANPPTGD
jgi:hypothetical protein